MALAGEKMVQVAPGGPHAYYVEGSGRCRRCDPCLRHRRRLWTRRALQECRASSRTWFGTLTLSPSEQQRYLFQAVALQAVCGVDFDSLDPGEQFRLRVAQIGPDIGRFLKRVRKESGCPLRYILVCELHKSGMPHFHMLLHERDVLQHIPKALLERQWSARGFSSWRLSDPYSAHYVCKYLAKTSAARVRASRFYGSAEQIAASAVETKNASRENMTPLLQSIEEEGNLWPRP